MGKCLWTPDHPTRHHIPELATFSVKITPFSWKGLTLDFGKWLCGFVPHSATRALERLL